MQMLKCIGVCVCLMLAADFGGHFMPFLRDLLWFFAGSAYTYYVNWEKLK